MSYRHLGKQKTLAIGVYPAVSSAKARKRRAEARELLVEGLAPRAAKQAKKLATRVAAANNFESVAREFHATQTSGWSPRYGARWIERMEKDLFPHIGKQTLPAITAPVLLDALRKVEKRGANETAHTLRQTAGQVFRYGVQTGRCERSPVADLHGALKPIVVKHIAAELKPTKAGEPLRAIVGYIGQPRTNVAPTPSLPLFHQWEAAPVQQVLQAITILKELQPKAGHGRYMFLCLQAGARAMSDNTVNAAVRRIGFGSDHKFSTGYCQAKFLAHIP